jgi:hypothetical protein
MWPQELEILSIYAENSEKKEKGETNKPLQGSPNSYIHL